MAALEAIAGSERIKTLTNHHIDGAFAQSQGREVVDIFSPTNGKVIARVTPGDEEDRRRSIAAAKPAFAPFGRATIEAHASYLRRLHEAVSARFAHHVMEDGKKPSVMLASLRSFDTFVKMDGAWLFVATLVRARRAEESLRRVQAELAHISRVTTLGQLTASIAHEIAQPISSARNNARAALNFLGRQPPELGEIRAALSCVVDDADRAGDIIDRIRDHIKKSPPRKARFDLNATINEVLVLARSAINENAVSVQTCLAEGLLPLQGDRVQLQQVLLNLVLNAVEAMGSVAARERDLLISTEPNQTGGVLIAVRDSGPGIDPEHRERVFEAFYTTKSSGEGMGLSICRSIIDAHGGRLWADVNEPRGAAFRFTLPAAENA
jgi:C4-dicarboxylate-specific signal transduction histidine kinase